MVLDAVRTSAYERAINDVVRVGDVVMDIGSGSGLLALFAARAGAKKVYAVECTDAARFVSEHAKENGFEDIVEVIRADILDVEESDIDDKPRVIVSEMLGNFAPGEDLHPIYQKAQSLAQADAVFIPSSYRMIIAAARPHIFEEYSESLGNVCGLSLDHMLNSIMSKVSYKYLQPEELVSAEVEGPDII
jgi:predicted RNA methylase